MNTKQAGGVAVSGHPPNPSRPRQFCDFTSNAIRHVPRFAIREFARPSSAMLLPLADSGFVGKLRLMIARIRSNLPIYILAVDNDPINHHLEWLKPLVQRYRRAVLRDVTEKYYPGGRHEMLNEINRDEVLKDFLSWSRRVCCLA
jgi:alpha-beta hydrolase superfamily lysophospholipase